MPRGTVHQAVAQTCDSAHVTISTYQSWSWGDVALQVLESTLAEDSMANSARCLPLGLRRSPAAGFERSTGYLAALSGAVIAHCC